MKEKLLFLFCLFTTTLFSQGVNNLWLLGTGIPQPPWWGGINLDFTGSVLNVNYETRKMNINCTNGVISDKSGNRLFYSNGIWIANSINDTMLNGNGLNPSQFTTDHTQYGLTLPQANLIIPFPGDSTKYYLFHQTTDIFGPTEVCALYLYYSVIDMTLDSGRGSVIQKNIILLQDSLKDGPLTACKHANGRDWWLVAHHYKTNKYYKYLITSYGISGPFIQDIGVWRGAFLGQVVFSPDGNRFAYYDVSSDLDIFDFDRCTGDFSLKLHLDINDSAGLGGCAFSPNSQVLYVSSRNYVYQFDMTSSDIGASKTTVAVYDGYYSPQAPLATSFYLSQLAPDGKIYINCGNGTLDIHVINNPDSLGLGCDLCQHCVHLGLFNAFTIPNHPNYFLGAESGSLCDTLLTGLTPNPPPQAEEGALRLFPNPVSGNGEVTFTYPSDGEVKSISVFNVEGKEVAGYSLPQWSSVQKVKLPGLAKGVYMARLHSVIARRLGDEAIPVLNVKFVVE